MKQNIFEYFRHHKLTPYEILIVFFGLTSPTKDSNNFVTINDASNYTGLTEASVVGIVWNLSFREFTDIEPIGYRINEKAFFTKNI